MAEIPVQRKSGLPWWIWPLAILGLLGLLWLAFGRDRDDDRETRANATPTPALAVVTSSPAPGLVSTTGAAAGGALNDVNAYVTANDKAAFIGRQAQLGNVRVLRVLSDRAFTVGATRGQEMFAMLDESLDNAGGKEQRVAIKEGQALSLSGTIERPPDAETAKERWRGLNAKEAAELKNQTSYLLVKNVSAAR